MIIAFHPFRIKIRYLFKVLGLNEGNLNSKVSFLLNFLKAKFITLLINSRFLFKRFLEVNCVLFFFFAEPEYFGISFLIVYSLYFLRNYI